MSSSSTHSQRSGHDAPARVGRAALYLAHSAFMIGLWLVAAPTVLGYSSGEPVMNDLICGALVALAALAAGSARSYTVLSLVSLWLLFGSI